MRSVNGPATTTIGIPAPSGRIVDIVTAEGPGAILEGFTVTGTTAELLLVGGSSPVVRHCRFHGNGFTIGVWVDASASPGSGPYFENVEIKFCNATDLWDWVGLTVLGPARVSRCSISGNYGWSGPVPGFFGGVGVGGDGGAIAGAVSWIPGGLTLEECVVDGNFPGVGDDLAGDGGLQVGTGGCAGCTVVDNGSRASMSGTWTNSIVRGNGPGGLPPLILGTGGDATGGNGPFYILRINGTAGYSGRTVEAALGAPLAFELAAPPGVTGPFSYAWCGMFGVPTATAAFATPFGPFLFLPAPVDPQAAGLFLLAGDIAFPAPAPVLTGPAPLTVTVPAGLSFPLTITCRRDPRKSTPEGGRGASPMRV